MKTKFKLGILAAAIALSVSACSDNSPATSAPQELVDAIASQLDISYEVMTNFSAQEGLGCQDRGAEWASCNKMTMTVVNDGPAITNTDWQIYLHSIRVLLEIENPDFQIEHITGDLYRLTPTASFKGFKENETVTLPIIGEYWQLFETDFMPRAYVTSGDAKPKNIESLDTEDVSSFVKGFGENTYKRTPEDNNILATAETRFTKNEDVAVLSKAQISANIIPTPLKVRQSRLSLNVDTGFYITNNALQNDQLNAFKFRAEKLGINAENGKKEIKLSKNTSVFTGDEAVSGAYKLGIDQTGVNIVGFDDIGAFYGLQSVLALLEKNGKTLPGIAIEDAPRFQYRGVMVDVARNFHSKDAIIRTLDQMAAYKLNKLHMHLSDDEGWRIEIPGLPELTDIGAKRCQDLSETTCLLPQLGSGANSDNFGSGYFSRKDYVEILKYAKARGIEVIPEIDIPAHARAAVVSMEARYKKYAEAGDLAKAEEYRLMDPLDTSNVTTVQFYDKRSFVNPCMDSSMRFVDKVITEIKAMHDEAGMPLTTWHFGGDEAKNIKLNAGFQDINAEEKVAWRGTIDQSVQSRPFEGSPMCQALLKDGTVENADRFPSYFAERVSEIVTKNNIPYFQAWQDGLKYSKDAKAFATEKTRVNFWDVLYWGGDASAYEWANKGYDVILSNPDYLYMDMPWEVDPKERGYYWATRATDTRKMFSFAPENLPQNAETSLDRDGNGFNGKGTVTLENPFYGLSAQLWSETVRTDEQYEYMVFPRVLAAAERAWYKADWELDYQANKAFNQDSAFVDKQNLLDDWTRFANVLGQREIAKLDAFGVSYRIPLPGAVIRDNKLIMNISLPGLPLQYSFDDGKTWNDYQEPVELQSVNQKITIRALSADRQRQGRESVI